MYTYTIYLDGTTINAKNNLTGTIDFTGDASTDCAPTINNAINNLKNSNQDPDFTGGVFLQAGYYKCKTTITVDLDDVGASGVTLNGEGWGTFLDFVPTGALSRGILLKMAAPAVKNMRIRGNSNVTALIEINGRINLQPRSNSNLFERLLLEGPNANGDLRESGDTFTPITGQIGIWFNAFVGAVNQFMFASVIDKCKFISLDKAILTTGVDATSVFISNFYSYKNTVFLEMTNTSGDHALVNGYIEGATYSRYGVHVVSSSANVLITNVFGELGVTGQECALVKIDTGNNAAGLFLSSGKNFLEDNNLWWTVLDENSTKLGMYPGRYSITDTNYFYTDNSTQTLNFVQKVLWKLNNSEPVQIYRDSNTLNNTVGIRFGFKDSNSAYQPYAYIFAKLIANTAGAQDGALSFWVKKAGSSTEIFQVTKDGVTLTDGKAFSVGSTTGTKIATAPTQKLGFYGVTPVAQQTGGAATASNRYGTTEQNMLQKLYDMARSMGLLS